MLDHLRGQRRASRWLRRAGRTGCRARTPRPHRAGPECSVMCAARGNTPPTWLSGTPLLGAGSRHSWSERKRRAGGRAGGGSRRLRSCVGGRARRERAAQGLRSGNEIGDDEAGLLALCDSPAKHWIHLRTTNPVESTLATVRLCAKVTSAGSWAAAPRKGLQACRVLPSLLERRERTSPRRPPPGRSLLRARPPCRTLFGYVRDCGSRSK
jgi:hypothetical protein